MENKNGALAFDVLIRDNNIQEMLSKDEKRIAQFTENVESNSDNIVNSFGNIGKAIGGIAVGAMLQRWVKDIVSVRGEFQQLEIAFTTMLGSGEKAQILMQQITETAATTPFDLKGVASGAKQLLAYGESANDVNKTLKQLGDIASGLSIPLNDMVYLYGTTMVQGRLFAQDVRQFMGRGIPLVQELSKQLGKTTEEINNMVSEGKIGFPEVQKVIESLTGSGGMFYNLMAEQSKSIAGQISNLGDSFDTMLNQIGKSNEGLISGSIELVASLVENYQQIINVVQGLIIAYGTYKGALIALAVAQNRSTGLAAIDMMLQRQRTTVNNTLSASLGLQAANTNILSTVTTGLIAKLRVLWATMLANPFTALFAGVGFLISAFTMFRGTQQDAADTMGEFESQTQKQIQSINTLKAVLNNTTAGSQTYNKAINKLNDLLKEHNIESIKEADNLTEIEAKYNALTKAIKQNTAERLIAKGAERLLEEQAKKEAKLLKDLQTNFTFKLFNYSEVSKNMTDESFAMIYATMKEHALEFENLDIGTDEYKKKLKEVEDTTIKMIANMTGASLKEAGKFRPFISDYIKRFVTLDKETQKQTKQMTERFSRAGDGLKESTKTVEAETDIMSLSLDELYKKADQLRYQSVTVDFKSVGYSDIINQLNNVDRLILEKQNKLNTEQGIQDEIKRLQDLKKNAEIGSKAYNDFTNQINNLQNRLPGKNTGKEGANALKDLAQKEIDIQFDLEQQRISIMRDGYEKYIAEAELEHKKELARIDREEKEIQEKYKQAGQRMPKQVKASFSEMRENENTAFDIKKSGLLDKEIDEKKKAYELYYKWVGAYGEIIANEQFADLIAQGETFTQYLENKINDLKQKQGGEVSLAGGTQLITLQTQYNEVTGAKTEFDRLTESIANAKDQSVSLSEYLSKLTEIKTDLQTGEINIIGEDKAKAIKQIDDEIAESNKTLQEKLLDAYKSSADLRLEVEKQFENDILWLKQNGFDKQAQIAEQAKQKSLAEIEAVRITSLQSWRDLFRNAGYLSSGAFDTIVEGLKKQVEAIEDVDVRKELLTQLRDLEAQTQGGKNPFRQIVKAINNYKNATDDLAQDESLQDLFYSIAEGAAMAKGAFDSVVGGLRDLGMAGNEESQEILGNVSEMMGGVADMAKGFATMNPVSMIKGGVSLITNAIKLFDATSRRIKREMKEHEQQVKSLQTAYDNIQFEVDNAIGNEYYEKQREAIENKRKQIAEYEALARLEQSKDSKDRDDEALQQYIDQAEQAKRDILEIEKEIRESLVQTNFKDLANDLADAWADAFSKMEDSAESFDDIWNKTIANAIKNSLKLEIIESKVHDFTQALADYMGANNNSVAGFDFDKWKAILQSAGEQFTNALEGFEEFFQDAEDNINEATLEGNIKSITEDTASILAGEITAMRIRQVEHLTVVKGIQNSMNMFNGLLQTAINRLDTIARNTEYNKSLYEIRDYLKGIKLNAESNPLRAKGYNV